MFAQRVPETISELSQPLIVVKLVQDFNDPPDRCKDSDPKFPDSLRGGSGARPMAASLANLPKWQETYSLNSFVRMVGSPRV